MRLLRLAALGLGLLAAVGCRIEDRTPTGTRRDEDAIQELVAQYARSFSQESWGEVRGLFWRNGSYSGPMVPRSVGQAVSIDSALGVIAQAVGGTDPEDFELRVLRTDFRQDGDVAAVWVTIQRRAPRPGSTRVVERDWVEHLVLRRMGGNWRILSVAGASAPRGSLGDRR